MSISVNVDSLSYESKEKINKELEIKLVDSYTGTNERLIYPYIVVDDQVKLPFAYGVKNLKLKRPTRNRFSQINIPFTGELRPEQKVVLKEALQTLNSSGSVIISAYPGFGKCLGYNTPVMMADGTIKYVQDIKQGDKLMGDDSKPRNVLSTCTGEEKMYELKSDKGDSFKANESHILSLKIHGNNIISFDEKNQKFIADFFDITSNSFRSQVFEHESEAKKFLILINSPDIIDITIKDYLNLSRFTKRFLYWFKVGIDFQRQDITIDPYKIGYLLYKSLETRIPENYLRNTAVIRLNVLAGIIDSFGYYINGNFEVNIYNNNELCNDIIYLCRSLGFYPRLYTTKYIHGYNFITINGVGIEKIPSKFLVEKIVINKNSIDALVSKFSVIPIDEKKYYGFVIDGNHRFLLGDFTVTHNTCSGINLSVSIGFKTLIVVNKIILMKQWEESIIKFCPSAKIQRLTAKSTIKQECDFYIMNAINIEKVGRTFFNDIGTAIVDEAHLIMAETLSKSLQYIHPRYLIALTATPYRPDGLDILLKFYFGDHKIIRELIREHTVYKIDTKFKPKIEIARNGKVNWGIVLDSQAIDVKRNELIIKLLRHFSSRNFLVLVKRVFQGEYIVKRLLELGESVTSLLGSQQEYDIDARILVGTSSKIGVGFDSQKLDALLLAADVEEYFIQYLGRVFRTEKVEPIIIDLVDNYSILEKHFNTRRCIYQKHGGTIKTFNF